MKKLILALACVLLLAGFAVAAEIDFRGMYYARGSYLDNDNGLSGSDTANYFFFDHELDITSRILVTDKTRVIVNFEIRDETWTGSPQDGSAENRAQGMDDNIEFKRVFSSHTFDYGGVLDLGLMTGAAWQTGFGDNGNGYYRVKYTQPTQLGPVIAIYEKEAEIGAANGSTKKAEKDDGNSYLLASVMKFGDFNFYPQIGYSDRSDDIQDQKSNGYQVFLLKLGADATFGDFGFETEFNYNSVNQDKKSTFNGDPTDTATARYADDWDQWGIYGNGWWNVGAGKVGLLAAYGSWEDDAGDGFGMGEDFTPTVFGADQTNIGGNSSTSGANTLSEYKAVTLVQLYGSLAISEQFSINGSALYWASNAKENADGTNNFWRDSDGYEIDAGLDYKITDAVTYTVAAAFGKISLDDKGASGGVTDDSPDGFVRAYHRFRIDF